MTSSHYVVELVQPSPNNREKTLNDIQSSLERLMFVSDSLFSHLESRLTQESQRLGELEKKLASCQERCKKTRADPSLHIMTSQSILPSFALPSSSSSLSFETIAPIQHFGEGVCQERDEPPTSFFHVEPELPVAVLSEMKHKIHSLVEHKLVWYAQAARSRVYFTNNTEGDTDRDKSLLFSSTPVEMLGACPQSLSYQVLFPTTDFSDGGSTAAAGYSKSSVGGNELFFSSEVTTLDSLGLPQDLTDVLPGIRKPTDLRVISKRSLSLPPVVMAEDALPMLSPVKTAPVQPQQQQESDLLPTPPLPPLVPSREEGEATIPRPVQNPLLSEIQSFKRSKAVETISSRLPPPATVIAASRTKTLAEEMREKLQRRQALLSGDRDEEEQIAERQRKRYGEEDEVASTVSSTTASAVVAPTTTTTITAGRSKKVLLPNASSASKPVVQASLSFGALFTREMSKTSVFQHRPNMVSEEDDEEWDDAFLGESEKNQ